MKRIKRLTKQDIIKVFKAVEAGDKYYKINGGGLVEAIAAARYYLEHDMSREDYKKKREEESSKWWKTLIQKQTCSA